MGFQRKTKSKGNLASIYIFTFLTVEPCFARIESTILVAKCSPVGSYSYVVHIRKGLSAIAFVVSGNLKDRKTVRN